MLKSNILCCTCASPNYHSACAFNCDSYVCWALPSDCDEQSSCSTLYYDGSKYDLCPLVLDLTKSVMMKMVMSSCHLISSPLSLLLGLHILPTFIPMVLYMTPGSTPSQNTPSEQHYFVSLSVCMALKHALPSMTYSLKTLMHFDVPR